ncbi:9,11-endoperoxide prostaglandin H2 reductase-like [Oppia nitens]|uniref:9,11-endoperoxide prostaglandin H2 reductase-like n=1 Tax=Oppia nitens TaxID=1686743 RepID=UPI0023DB6489|nr:9,11-endoperoxide prostaglandin H2 reductase-like [Oppia nitens]
MIYDAVDIGYRHIDTAEYYENEQSIGEAVNDLIETGRVLRQDLFVTTKIFFKKYPIDNIKDETVSTVVQSLKRLNLDYVDLMLIHWPSDNMTVNSDIWKGLEEVLDRRLVRAIGVSNFMKHHLVDLLKTAKVVPQMNQIESNPLNNNQQLIDYCQQSGIQVTAYSPLGRGRLVDDPTVQSVATKHNKTGSQVLIRYQLQKGVAAIPKSTRKERMSQNLQVFDFSLTEEDMTVLNSMSTTNNNDTSIR